MCGAAAAPSIALGEEGVVSLTPVRFVMYRFPLTRDENGEPVWYGPIRGAVGRPVLTENGKLRELHVTAPHGFDWPHHSHYASNEEITVHQGELHIVESGFSTDWHETQVVVKAGETHVIPETVDHGGYYVADLPVEATIVFDPPHEIKWVGP